MDIISMLGCKTAFDESDVVRLVIQEKLLPYLAGLVFFFDILSILIAWLVLKKNTTKYLGIIAVPLLLKTAAFILLIFWPSL